MYFEIIIKNYKTDTSRWGPIEGGWLLYPLNTARLKILQ